MKTLLTGLMLGIFGAIAVYISVSLQWPTWVMFIAWVSYYVFGKTLKQSLAVFIQIVFGIIMGLLIQVTGIWLSGIAGALGLPLAVFFFYRITGLSLPGKRIKQYTCLVFGADYFLRRSHRLLPHCLFWHCLYQSFPVSFLPG